MEIVVKKYIQLCCCDFSFEVIVITKKLIHCLDLDLRSKHNVDYFSKKIASNKNIVSYKVADFIIKYNSYIKFIFICDYIKKL